MDEPLIVQDGVVIAGAELKVTASRSGGPGGQHVNKVSSRVTLEWDLANTTALDERQRAAVEQHLKNRLTKDGVVQIHVDDERSQKRNREIARARLKTLIETALKPKKKRIPTKMSAAQKQRRLAEKAKRAQKKRLRQDPESE